MKIFFNIVPPGVQRKFLLGLAGILFFFCLLWAATMYSYQRNRLQEEAFRRTELVMEAVNASRAYIREILRPRMYDLLGRDVFIIEAMSTSYATRVIMEKFREGMPNITYRRVAINARNPEFEADQQEQEMIQYFNENPETQSWQGIREVGEERYYVRYSPVHYETSCLHCHGKPEDAPGSIVESYGKTKGFNMKTDHVYSVVSVGIQVEESLRRIGQFAVFFFATIFMSFFLLYAIIAFSFNRLIVQNIRALLDTFRLNLTDRKGEHLYEQARNMDEIGELHATATLLAKHLQENRLQLEDYAENLEIKVEERTKELQRSQEQLHRQMLSQGRELNTLNVIAELITQSVDLLSILPKVLRQTLEVIPAKGAGIYLFRADCQGFFLQCRDNAPELVDQLVYDMASRQIRVADVAKHPSVPSTTYEVGCDELNFSTTGLAGKKLLNIPLCCRKRLLGVMTLTGYDVDEIDPKHRELLLSIGRQVGITMESLQNMASLLQGKELLQSVFDAIADLVVLISPDGFLNMVNRAFLTGYQFSPEMIIGRRIEDLAREYPVPFLLFSQISLIKLQEPVSDYKRLANGQFFETHYYPAFDDHGVLKNIVCYAKDVTLQKQVEHRMQQAEKLVALGQLAAGIAHEINNPLGIILCYTDLLKEDLTQSPDRVKDLDVIEKHAKNCQHIVRDLLSFARNQQTSRTLDQINTAIEQVASMVTSQLAKQGITMTLDIDAAIPPFEVDMEKMKQVFMNLIMNAAQAMGENRDDGKIAIQSRYLSAKDQVEISVRDNGQGIAPEIQDKIFDPFFTTKGPQEGTGLGLSLSYGIVHDHGGEIYVHSTLGQETVFTLLLPLHGA
jgi:PAS domain S-box-containing protein